MKKYTSQQGSAHVVIVICLVLALMTALGWIFYQNFIHKEPAARETDLLVVDKTKNNVEAKDSKKEISSDSDGYVVIKEWKVKFKIPSSLEATTVGYEGFKWNEGTSTEHQGYGLFTARTKQEATDCSKSSRLILLSRSKEAPRPDSADTMLASNEPISGYYYTFSDQAAHFCTTSARNDLIREAGLLVDMVKTIEKE